MFVPIKILRWLKLPPYLNVTYRKFIGNDGEEKAEIYLKNNGYDTVRTTEVTHPCDIIATKDNVRYAINVKHTIHKDGIFIIGNRNVKRLLEYSKINSCIPVYLLKQEDEYFFLLMTEGLSTIETHLSEFLKNNPVIEKNKYYYDLDMFDFKKYEIPYIKFGSNRKENDERFRCKLEEIPYIIIETYNHRTITTIRYDMTTCNKQLTKNAMEHLEILKGHFMQDNIKEVMKDATYWIGEKGGYFRGIKRKKSMEFSQHIASIIMNSKNHI